MPQAWVLVHLRAHGGHPVSHNETLHVKTYFDEDPGDTSDEVRDGGQIVVPVEHSIPVNNINNTRCWHKISEEEFNAGNYNFYVWSEPYASAAFQKNGVMDDLAVGRLKLTKSKEDGRKKGSAYPQRYAAVADDDNVIEFQVKLANSVIQFIVDEINTNVQEEDVQTAGDRLEDARERVAEEGPWGPSGQRPRHSNLVRRTPQGQLDIARRQSENVLGHRTHGNEGFAGFVQDIYWGGGGEWDHKPRIRPVWGAFNRLGNRHEVYFYDGWSNIHYGYIAHALDLTLQRALEAAGQAQGIDNSGSTGNETTTGDDPADAQAITAGYNLFGTVERRASSQVTRQDIINILNRHPGWIGRA